MKLPYLNGTNRKASRQIVTFGGVNYQDSGGEGELEGEREPLPPRFPPTCASGTGGPAPESIRPPRGCMPGGSCAWWTERTFYTTGGRLGPSPPEKSSLPPSTPKS